jgi:hypothetical protein
MIERGGYGFGDRATALLGSAASADTLALVQQTVRATNPAGFMQAARFIAEAEMPPLAAGLTMPLLIIQGGTLIGQVPSECPTDTKRGVGGDRKPTHEVFDLTLPVGLATRRVSTADVKSFAG